MIVYSHNLALFRYGVCVFEVHGSPSAKTVVRSTGFDISPSDSSALRSAIQLIVISELHDMNTWNVSVNVSNTSWRITAFEIYALQAAAAFRSLKDNVQVTTALDYKSKVDIVIYHTYALCISRAYGQDCIILQ